MLKFPLRDIASNSTAVIGIFLKPQINADYTDYAD
jgi:hypothetical protein